MDHIALFVDMMDSFLIAPYRWPKNPMVGWWVGTFILAVWSTILGELTVALAFRANRSHVREAVQEMVERHNQSMNALKAGDKGSYKAINKLANEAYGKTFFLQLAMASASLWPVPFALAWMQSRFSNVHFPLPFNMSLIGDSVSYPFVFIPLYILTRMLFGKARKYLPYFKG
jgi:hypothetical protein